MANGDNQDLENRIRQLVSGTDIRIPQIERLDDFNRQIKDIQGAQSRAQTTLARTLKQVEQGRRDAREVFRSRGITGRFAESRADEFGVGAAEGIRERIANLQSRLESAKIGQTRERSSLRGALGRLSGGAGGGQVPGRSGTGGLSKGAPVATLDKVGENFQITFPTGRGETPKEQTFKNTSQLISFLKSNPELAGSLATIGFGLPDNIRQLIESQAGVQLPRVSRGAFLSSQGAGKSSLGSLFGELSGGVRQGERGGTFDELNPTLADAVDIQERLNRRGEGQSVQGIFDRLRQNALSLRQAQTVATRQVRNTGGASSG